MCFYNYTLNVVKGLIAMNNINSILTFWRFTFYATCRYLCFNLCI